MQSETPYIYNSFLKVVMLFAVWLVDMGIAFMLTPRTDMSDHTKYLIVGLIGLALVYILGRWFFRTMAERNMRRPWWRVTASPLLGWVLSVVFVLVGIQISLGSNLFPPSPLLGAAHIAFACLFVISALRPVRPLRQEQLPPR